VWCDCRIVNGALNYQIYARPSFEIISLALQDPLDRESAAVAAAHAGGAESPCFSASCNNLLMVRADTTLAPAANLMSVNNCIARLVSGNFVLLIGDRHGHSHQSRAVGGHCSV
jgi:hypothetical protein